MLAVWSAGGTRFIVCVYGSVKMKVEIKDTALEVSMINDEVWAS